MTNILCNTALSGSLLAIAACAMNPVTGRNEFSLVSESQEIAMGRQGKADVEHSIGVYTDQGFNAYLTDLGTLIARTTERPGLPWSFQIADQPVVNAFALPGGPVFLARGILPYFNSEAELISVLGHEMGHIAARHSAQQITRSQLAGLGLGVASIVDARLAKIAGVAEAGLGILFLKYSRDNEAQADALGFRYGVAGGWDMREGTNMFNTLSRVSGDPSQRLPEWQSSHPAPEGRAEHNDERVRAAEAAGTRFDALRVDRNGYLRRLAGLVYGEDPRQGYFEGTTFYHPALRLRFAFPDGWKTQNGTDAVAGMSPAQDAIVVFSGTGTESPQATGRKFAAQEGLTPGQGQALTINGLTAWTMLFSASTEQGVVAGRATWVALDGTTYLILGYSPQAKASANDAAFLSVARSLARLTDAAKINVVPKRVYIVQLRTAQTIVEAGRANGGTLPNEELAAVNGVRTDQVLAVGTLVKIMK
ncbi:MAG: M48 family metalloprotease [Gemmatimonadota bacterium]